MNILVFCIMLCALLGCIQFGLHWDIWGMLKKAYAKSKEFYTYLRTRG